MKNINVTNNQGIGVWIRNGSNVNMDSCLINNNERGGFYLWLDSEAAITNTIIEDNEGFAFRIEDWNSSATMENVIIQNNNGVGLYCKNSNLIANDLFVINNKALGGFHDGGVSIKGSTASLTNDVITDNEVQGRGGGIYIDN